MSDRLLQECVRQLRSSPHDYEKLLGSSVDAVWRAISSGVERQLRLRKGVGVPSLGKFAFVRDLHPPMPVFLLVDRFASSYGVSWRRPPPAVLTPIAELSLSVIGCDSGGIPKHQVSKALEALLCFVGIELQKGSATGRLRLGNVGSFVLDGKSLAFQFDVGFIKSVATPQGNKSDGTEGPRSISRLKLDTRAGTPSIARAVSLQLLAPLEHSTQETAVEKQDTIDSIVPKKKHERHELGHRSHSGDRQTRNVDSGYEEAGPSRRHRHHHSRSSKQLPVAAALTPLPGSEYGAQILPRFMLPDSSGSPSKLVYRQQSESMQRTFEFKRADLEDKIVERARQDDEIDRRIKATRLRCIEERAQKAIVQRDLDAVLHMQIESKQREHERLHALDTASTNFDAVRVLPRDPVITREQHHATKLKLSSHLLDQVALKETLTQQRHAVERAESAYFMSKVEQQAERERNTRSELKRMVREVLTTGWEQQRAIREQSEQLEPGRKPRSHQ